MVVSYIEEMRAGKLALISFQWCIRRSLNTLIRSKTAHSCILYEYCRQVGDIIRYRAIIMQR